MIVAHVFKATGLSGSESHLLSLARGLRDEGIESHLIILIDPTRLPDTLIHAARAQGTPTHLVQLNHDLDLFSVPKIKTILDSVNAQLVHTHLIHGDLFGTLAAGKRVVVQSRHNDDRFRHNVVVKLLTRYLASRAKTIIAISDSLANFVRDVEGVTPSKITRIHYGLDPNEIVNRAKAGMLREELKIKDSPLIGAVGRLTEQKGFDYLLEAFARVRDNVNEAHLVIAGDGERRHALESKARLLNIADAVHFLGWRNDVPSIMIDLDILVVPSLWEGFGLVTLEAMALSKPIVASNVSALPEIISHGETGLLVPPADSAALADSILNLLRDPEKAKTFGPRGRARLEKEFTIQRMAQRHVVVYKEAASRVPEFRA